MEARITSHRYHLSARNHFYPVQLDELNLMSTNSTRKSEGKASKNRNRRIDELKMPKKSTFSTNSSLELGIIGISASNSTKIHLNLDIDFFIVGKRVCQWDRTFPIRSSDRVEKSFVLLIFDADHNKSDRDVWIATVPKLFTSCRSRPVTM